MNQMRKTAVLGAGLSGLAAGYVLTKNGNPVTIFEAENSVGGASKTISFDGFRFDLGGHRFYSKKQEINSFIKKVMGEEITEVQRVSKIYLNGKMFNYPLTIFNAFFHMGASKTTRILAEYFSRQIRNKMTSISDVSYKDWVTNRFGKTLAQFFFIDYGEKVWGIPTDKLSSDFAKQRIRSLSLWGAIKNAMRRSAEKPNTLIHRFYYPKLGFGRIAERLAEEIGNRSIRLNSSVEELKHSERRIESVKFRRNQSTQEVAVEDVISSIPITSLVKVLNPKPDAEVLRAAESLLYRNLIIVFLALDRDQVTDLTWMYFPGKDITFSRLHEPKNWSQSMAPEGKSSLVVEYFCSEGDAFWEEKDESLKDQTVFQLEKLGLIEKKDLMNYKVIRLRYAYPVYDLDYGSQLRVLMDYLSRFVNLQSVGRNGLFRYASSDHYIEMGIKAAKNLLGESHDLSQIGLEDEYAEE
jgi:protoporphyrinogen oxidase